MTKPLFTSSDWNVELIEEMWKVIDKIATEKYGLSYFKPQIEIVTYAQMIHYSSMIGLPFSYSHWSFGKSFISTQDQYKAGKTGLAYEMIINSDPMLCYIMENNTATMQATVLAHAVVGHGSMFKMNECFKQWTHPDSVLAYCKYAKDFVAECEEKYGADNVERLLDSIHALQYLGIDKYPRARAKRKEEIAAIQAEKIKEEEKNYNPLWDATVPKHRRRKPVHRNEFNQHDLKWPYPEENILYFIEKNSPRLEDWEKELVRIVRYFAQYFFPQMQCKLLHEGWASFWHYTIMNDLHEEGYLTDGSMFEFLNSHTSICSTHTEEITTHFSPYDLGFKIFKKLRQVCENPTEQDKIEFPTVHSTDWIETFKDIAANYTDSTLLGQFLSSETAEELGMAVVQKVDEDTYYDEYNVNCIQDMDSLKELRKSLRDQYSISNTLPQIEIFACDFKGSRTLYLRHHPVHGQALDAGSLKACLKHLVNLWGYPVSLETVDKNGDVFTTNRRYPSRKSKEEYDDE